MQSFGDLVSPWGWFIGCPGIRWRWCLKWIEIPLFHSTTWGSILTDRTEHHHNRSLNIPAVFTIRAFLASSCPSPTSTIYLYTANKHHPRKTKLILQKGFAEAAGRTSLAEKKHGSWNVHPPICLSIKESIGIPVIQMVYGESHWLLVVCLAIIW